MEVPWAEQVQLKIVVVGNQGAGKTGVIERFTNQQFTLNRASTTTINMITTVQTVKNTEVRLHFWDIPWFYDKQLPRLLLDTQGVVIVFDPLDPDFRGTVRKWRLAVLQNLPYDSGYIPPFIVLANKFDAYNMPHCREMTEMCAELGILAWHQVSAKGNYKVDEAINGLILEILHTLQQAEKLVPKITTLEPVPVRTGCSVLISILKMNWLKEIIRYFFRKLFLAKRKYESCNLESRNLPLELPPPSLLDMDITLKVVLVGDLYAGKTAILRRIMHNSFATKTRSTIGVNFELMDIPRSAYHPRVRIQFYDVGGAEKYGRNLRTFYGDAWAVIIVCDASKPALLESLASVREWQRGVYRHLIAPANRQIPVLLLANKMDRVKSSNMDTVEQRMHDFSELNQFAGWFPVSAKTNRNIKPAIRCVMECAVNSYLRYN